MRGPIDYIIVGFEGNKFDGSILRALSEAIDSGAIALVALAFIRKDKDGTVERLDVANLGDTYAVTFVEKYAQDESSVADEDIDEMAELLEGDTAAGLLIIEQLWAKPLKKAMLKANGVLVAEGRIHPDAAAELSNEGGK
jgi:hypothetical protein